jgi:hypothetical protein
MRTRHHDVPIAKEDDGVERLAEAGGTGDDRVQHRLDVGRRAADDAQDLRGGGLLLQRLVALALRTREFFFKICIGVLRHQLRLYRDARQRLNGSRAAVGGTAAPYRLSGHPSPFTSRDPLTERRQSPVGVLCHEYRRSTRRCVTVREMKEGPSRSAIRC